MDKIDRLLDAIENPGNYSTAEIEELLHDPEAKEILDLLDKIKASLHPVQTPDVEKEWEKFKINHQNFTDEKLAKDFPFRLLGFFSRKVAAIIAIAIVSISAVAAIVGISIRYLNPKSHDSETTSLEKEIYVVKNQPDSVEKIQSSEPTPGDIVIFDNEPLGSIMTQIGDYYGYKIEFKDNSIKSLRLYYRWKQEETIEEVVESLNNFEQIHLTLEDKTIKID